MNNATKPKYKRYDEAFKRQAVEHYMVSGQSGRRIAVELGINEQSLKVWKQKFKKRPSARWPPHAGCSPGRESPSATLLRDAQEQRTFY